MTINSAEKKGHVMMIDIYFERDLNVFKGLQHIVKHLIYLRRQIQMRVFIDNKKNGLMKLNNAREAMSCKKDQQNLMILTNQISPQQLISIFSVHG
jgi:hypothetical protein